MQIKYKVDGTLVSDMKGTPVVNLLSKTVFKKKDGSYAGDGDLEDMGYSPFPAKELNGQMYRPLFCYGAKDGAGVIDGYIMCRNGKYGVVDSHGNTLFPFIHTDYVFVYWNGFFITSEAEVVEEDYGFVRYTKWYDIYKDGKKIFEKISNINIVTGYDFICFYADEGDNAFIMNNKGQEIKKVPYGKNYFKNVLYEGDEILSREDMLLNISHVKNYRKKGKHIVYKEEKPGSNYMVRTEYEVKEDAYAMFNAEGEMVLPFKFDEIGHFSEGLIHVKYKGRWYYTNQKGEGLPTDALKERIESYAKRGYNVSTGSGKWEEL